VPVPLVELAPGVHRVAVAPADLVNVFVLSDDEGAVTLVDAGLRNAPGKLLAALRRLGKAPQDVQTIVLTHAHPDHAGGLSRMTQETGAQVAVHERDATHLRSGRTPGRDRSTVMGRLFNRLPRGGFAPAEVDQEFADGEVLKVAGGLRVVHTPGHSPGHVSLLHEPTGVLITGDAIFNVRGLRYSPKSFCTDIRLSRETADRLADLDYDIAAFTHGAEIRQGAREAVRAFLRGRAR
jgi:glyoxylase-like metal-dependent hydrolase (beta-lactamase superfamily II)